MVPGASDRAEITAGPECFSRRLDQPLVAEEQRTDNRGDGSILELIKPIRYGY